jgi:RNA polymerase sigma-70 factor (sigma-E family)
MSSAQRDREFARFVEERSPRLLLLARHLCGDPHLAEDLTQTVLEKVYLKWARVSAAEDPYLYVRRMLVNSNNDRLRKQPWREHPVAFTPDRAAAGSDRPTATDQAMLLDRLALHRALADLTPRERAVVVLRYLEDLTEADTAAELGIRVGTVKSACNRALGKLREFSRLADDEEVR